jgi:hypothetical protein
VAYGGLSGPNAFTALIVAADGAVRSTARLTASSGGQCLKTRPVRLATGRTILAATCGQFVGPKEVDNAFTYAAIEDDGGPSTRFGDGGTLTASGTSATLSPSDVGFAAVESRVVSGVARTTLVARDSDGSEIWSSAPSELAVARAQASVVHEGRLIVVGSLPRSSGSRAFVARLWL